MAFSGPPDDAEAHFAAIGRPFSSLLADGDTRAATTDNDDRGGNGGGGGGVVLPGSVNPTDALLDVIGDAEAMVDREGAAVVVDGGVEGGGCGLVVMPRELLVEQVKIGRGEETILSFGCSCLSAALLCYCVNVVSA